MPTHAYEVVALNDYRAVKDQGAFLPLRKGHSYFITHQDEPGWATAVDMSGHSGLVPLGYVEAPEKLNRPVPKNSPSEAAKHALLGNTESQRVPLAEGETFVEALFNYDAAKPG